MLNLPDHGYVNYQLTPIDAGGKIDGSMGGPADIIDRPGYRYSIRYDLPALPTADDARVFQLMLEQASREDVSYPWPLDIKSRVAGTPLVSGSSAPGSTLPVKGLIPNFQFRIGQPMAVIIADGTGFIHRAASATIADGSGNATVPVFPLTRTTFPDNAVIEVERPRIRGVLSWEGASQGTFGARPFSFTITERR